MKRVVVCSFVAVACLVACGKDASHAGDPPAAKGAAPAADPDEKSDVAQITADVETEQVVAAAHQNLAALHAAVTATDPDGASDGPCSRALRNPAVLEKADAALAKEVEQLCWHDLPVATLKAEVTRLSAEKITPDTKLRVCMHARPIGYNVAVETLTKRHTADAESAALVAKEDAICPPR